MLVAGRGIATSRTSLQEETARALEGHVCEGGRGPEESDGGDEADEEANERGEVDEGDDDLVGADVRIVLDCC